MPLVLLSPRGGRRCRQESAEAIVAPSTRGEGPNFVLRTGAFAVREAAAIEGRTEMCGADAEYTGRNPGEAA
jgi:hypothetical protein